LLEWVPVSARLLQFAGALSLFGISLFCLYGYRVAAEASSRWPRIGVLTAASTALIGALLWVGAQTATFFPNTGFFDLESNWIVLTETGFGRATFLREGSLVASIAFALVSPLSKPTYIVQTILGSFIVANFAWVGHGVYDSGLSGLVHTGADVLHLLSAAIWIGALVSLSILMVRSLNSGTENDAQAALNGLERFTGIGPATVGLLLITGIVNSWFLVGIAQWRALFTTEYGIVLTIKLIFFAAMLFLAAANRFLLSPRLRASLEAGLSPALALRKLRRSIGAELLLSLAVLAAVAWLGTREPPVAL
jgi:putative copper resistance protein D